MIRIVHEHYPVWKLPEDLREGFDPNGTVTLIIESEEDLESVGEKTLRPPEEKENGD